MFVFYTSTVFLLNSHLSWSCELWKIFVHFPFIILYLETPNVHTLWNWKILFIKFTSANFYYLPFVLCFIAFSILYKILFLCTFLIFFTYSCNACICESHYTKNCMDSERQYFLKKFLHWTITEKQLFLWQVAYPFRRHCFWFSCLNAQY